MDATIDLYFELLGIPESEQPPNFYRLLGIPEFTADSSVIQKASAHQMRFLRRVGGQRYGDGVGRLANEVAEARLQLMNQAQRAEYDASLREHQTCLAENAIDRGERSIGQSPVDGRLSKPLIEFIVLSGQQAGQTFAFQTDEIVLGVPDYERVVIAAATVSGTVNKVLVFRHNEQWFLEIPRFPVVVNNRLRNKRCAIENGDIIRFSVGGPHVQIRYSDRRNEFLNQLRERFSEKVDQHPPRAAVAASATGNKSAAKATGNGFVSQSESNYAHRLPVRFWIVGLVVVTGLMIALLIYLIGA